MSLPDRQPADPAAVLHGIGRLLRDGPACADADALGRLCLAVARSVTGARFAFLTGADLARWPQADADGTPALLDGDVPNGFRIADARYQSVPLTDDGQTLGLLGVDGGARAAAEALAPAIVQLFRSRRAETALRESERRLETVLEVLPAGVAITDAAGRLVRGNAAMRELWGAPPETPGWEHYGEWIGWRPDTGERIAADEWAMSRALLKGEETWGELVENQRFGSGERRFFVSNVVPLRDEDGRIAGGVAAMLDVTRERQAERALRDSEARLGSAFHIETIGITFWRPGPSYLLAETNDAFLRTIGRTREEALGMSSEALTAPEFHALSRRLIVEAERTGFLPPYEKQLVRPDGSRAWVLCAGRMVGGALFEFILDIDERHRAADALRASERRLQTLVEGVPQLVWRGLDGGRWTWASPQWTAYTGQPEADSRDLGWLDAVHPDDRDHVMAAWAEAAGRGTFQADFRIRHAEEGRHRWFQSRAAPVRDEDGRVVEWLGTSTDVDDLRRLQERQQQLVSELQHRVRNILTVVRSVFSRTAHVSDDLEEVADHFTGRLDSLARTQVAVSQRANGLVDLENLIREELLSVGAQSGPSVVIEGPEVALLPRAAESIGLAIHELTINAVKYGALKNGTGTLKIQWETNLDYGEAPRLDLTWWEQGVPVVPLQPTRRGFGFEQITEALPYRLGAETKLEFRGGGIRCLISVPLPDVGPGAGNLWEADRS